MQDYLLMKKVWFDNELIELQVTASAPLITASAKIYVSDYMIDDLFCRINRLLSGNEEECFWTNTGRGDDSTTCVSLRFLRKDNLGHFMIEGFMELDDGGSYADHNCCFYVNTETGLLDWFCKSLPALKQNETGISVCLNDVN